MATSLSTLLPSPKYSHPVEGNQHESSNSLTSTSSSLSHIPPYGNRIGWKPRTAADFADGGAYPECPIAQYPLDLGRKKTGNSGNTVALQVDGDGNVRYDAIVLQGRRKGEIVQSRFKDLVPLSQRTDIKEKDRSLERPSEEEVMSTAERTRLALEKITQSKIKSALPKSVGQANQDAKFIRYTPGQQGSDGGKQRIIKMTEAKRDPLEPPRHKFKNLPAGPPSPPHPVLRSPPRKVTVQEQKDWMIPPCISNWKNNKGYTIPLDKRLAADGRGLQDVYINDGFSQFTEALTLADRHAREEVRQRSVMQQKLAAKEKAAREEHLRNLAQRAREERAGIASSAPSEAAASVAGDDVGGSRPGPSGRVTASGGGTLPAALAAYGSDSSDSDASEDEDEAATERDRIREERKRERERDLRMSNMGTEARAKMLAREQNRDVSEKVALGLAKPTMSKDSITDSRLFNQEKLSSGYGDEDSYNLYDKPLFSESSAAAAIYKRPAGKGGAEDIYGGGTSEGFDDELKNDRFGLGTSKAFQGAEVQETRSGPVQFEKDISDPFAIDQFLEEAKKGTKRSGLDTSTAETRKRQKE